MIDIHSHIVPSVDDGSSDLAQSLEMIKNAVSSGVKGIVATPHLRFDVKASKAQIISKFNELNEAVKQNGIDVKLYLGQEIYVTMDYKRLLESKEFISINDGKYILLEFDVYYEFDICEAVYEIVLLGYTPIIAHIERYTYVTLEMAREIRRYGGLIQVNADAVLGKEGRKQKKFIKKLFKERLVDFVASDEHSFRPGLITESYAYVNKKFGKQVADKVFYENAKIMLGGA